MIGDPSSHCGRHSQRLVDAAEVVKREPARDRGPVVLPLLAKGIRKPGGPPVAHARAQIVALDY